MAFALPFDPALVVSPLQRAVGDLALVYLFGSRTSADVHPESDLDVAFLADAPLAPMQRFELQENLARSLGADVDLVDLRRASTVMCKQVISTGKVLFERDHLEREHFETRALSAYVLLNEERQRILEDIQRRGSVYGSPATFPASTTTMTSDVTLNKAATIERCLKRVREEYAGDSVRLTDNLTRQDAIILNLQRTCQASIDLATHLVRKRNLGVPQTSRDAFEMLIEDGFLEEELGKRLLRMVGFQNIAIHDYQRLNLDIVEAIITKHLGDFEAFSEIALRA